MAPGSSLESAAAPLRDGQALTGEDQALVKKLVDSNFKGYAQARLRKLQPAVLNELVRLSSAPSESHPVPASTVDQKVAHVLAAKKQVHAKKGNAPASIPPTIAAAPEADVPAPPPRKVDVFRSGHGISIVAFNSLKLRLDHADLKDEWDAAVIEFAKHDVLVLSEVRAGDKHFKPRVLRLVEMLNGCSEREWAWQTSEPSKGEVHLLMAKRPVEIVKVLTLHAIDGVALDYAPLVAHISDTRFVGDLRRFCVTSVHAPPNSSTARRSQRDTQVAKLLATYPLQADLRLGLPFTDKAATETRQERAYTAHVLCGDFNASASELRELGSERHGWETVFGNLRTSSGGKAYDNFLVNRDTKDHLTLSSRIYDLSRFANFSRGEQGISDHAPIVLTLSEVPPRM